ncbi:hypothetical protein JCM3766R1_005030 [Sporobolomyces carnicolor]
MTKQSVSDIDWSHGAHGTYQGKDANNVYQGYKGLLLNPNSSAEDKKHAHHMMAVFENSRQRHAQALRGALLNPNASAEAKAHAGEKLNTLPNWGVE